MSDDEARKALLESSKDMAPVQGTVDVNVPIDVLWEAFIHANRWPLWNRCVRALWLDRSFWFYRLPLLQKVLPQRTLMPWPQFHLEGQWVDFDELYGPIAGMAGHSVTSHPFTKLPRSQPTTKSGPVTLRCRERHSRRFHGQAVRHRV